MPKAPTFHGSLRLVVIREAGASHLTRVALSCLPVPWGPPARPAFASLPPVSPRQLSITEDHLHLHAFVYLSAPKQQNPNKENTLTDKLIACVYPYYCTLACGCDACIRSERENECIVHMHVHMCVFNPTDDLLFCKLLHGCSLL